MNKDKAIIDKIYIRADGNDVIATGHIMRCLSIALQIRKLGTEVVFVTADESPRSLIESKGFSVDVLGTIWDNLDDETETICRYVDEHNVRVLVVDSYYVTERYLEKLSEITSVVYIDDLYAFAYPVRTLINYGVFADVDKYNELYAGVLKPDYLIGSKYIPLRDEFADIERDINIEVRKILITTGGTDRLNVAGKLIEKLLLEAGHMAMEYHVIVGCFNNNKDMLYSLAGKSNGQVILHENVTKMSVYMKDCDVAISASGSTLYELCTCGTPTICFEIAPNQEGSKRWEDEGYMLYAGNAAKDMDSCIETCVKHLMWYSDHYNERCRMSSDMQNLVDGKGAYRIAKYLTDD